MHQLSNHRISCDHNLMTRLTGVSQTDTQKRQRHRCEGEGRSNTRVLQVAVAFQTHTHTLTREHICRCRKTHSHIWPVYLLWISGIEGYVCTRLHVTASHLAGCMNKHGCLCSASSLQSASIRSEDDSKTVDSSVIQTFETCLSSTYRTLASQSYTPHEL